LPKKEKKESWREKQRKRQLKQQRAQEAYQIQREREAEKKPRKWPKGKILGGFFLILLLFGAYGVWQSTQPSTEPPAINPTNPLETLYEFTMRDINGTQFSLNSFRGNVILIHILGVGCSGGINNPNPNQLTQLKTVCNSFCGKAPVTLITIAAATCPDWPNVLAQIRTIYGISWWFGNDYEDKTFDIVQKYATHGDGTIVLIDKAFHISDSYGTITASTLSSKINQLLGA